MVTEGGGDFPSGKALRAWIWPLNSICCRGQELWSYIPIPLSVHIILCLFD
jgi:hypothetical protein